MPNAFAISHDSHGKSHRRSWDWAIASLAERQHGVVSYAQLIAAGLGRGAIEWRLAQGRLHRMRQGVYAVGHSRLRQEGRWMAAVLAGGRGAVLSHRSAAAHLGLRPPQATVEVTVSRRLRARPGLRFHHSRLPADEVTVHDRIPITTVPRTLFDLAAVIPAGQLARALNEAEIRRLWDPLSLQDLLERHPRRPGAAAIRAALGIGAQVTRSELEDRFLDFLGRAGLPRPGTNVPMRLGDRWIEADCLWPHQRLLVELDGYGSHHTRLAYERDRARDRALTAAGWRVIRITWRQLHDEPEALARDLRASLTRAPR
jgi:predicted transcriptional regulator of viral defense system